MNLNEILTDSAHYFDQKPAIIFKDKIVNFIELKGKVLALALLGWFWLMSPPTRKRLF